MALTDNTQTHYANIQGGATNGKFTSDYGAAIDLFYANHLPQVYKRFGSQFDDFLPFMMSMGRVEPVDSYEVTLHEENRYHTYVTLASNAAATLAANTTATPVPIVSNTYVRIGDVLALSADGSKQGRVMAVNSATSIDICPIGSSTISISNNQVCPILSSMFQNGTGQPTPAISGYSKTTFKPSIIKETVATNGRELVLGTWFKDTFFPHVMMQGEYRQSLKIANALLLGQTVDHTSPDALSGYENTKGLIPTIKSRGGVQSYTGGSYALDDLHDIHLHMLKNGVTGNVAMILAGTGLVKDMSDAAKDFLNGGSGAVGVGQFNPVMDSVFKGMYAEDKNENGYNQMQLDFNFKIFNVYNQTFILKTMTHFDNPTTLAAGDMKFTGSGIVFPVANISDAKNGKSFQNIAIRPLAKNGYSRFMETWQVGAAGGNKSTYVDDTDALKCYWRSDLMFQIAGANQMVYIAKS